MGISSTGLQSLGVSLSSYPKDRTELIKLKEDLEMELLWIQQAMKSRETVSTICAIEQYIKQMFYKLFSNSIIQNKSIFRNRRKILNTRKCSSSDF